MGCRQRKRRAPKAVRSLCTTRPPGVIGRPPLEGRSASNFSRALCALPRRQSTQKHQLCLKNELLYALTRRNAYSRAASAHVAGPHGGSRCASQNLTDITHQHQQLLDEMGSIEPKQIGKVVGLTLLTLPHQIYVASLHGSRTRPTTSSASHIRVLPINTSRK